MILVMLVAIRTTQWENIDSLASLLGLVEWAYIAIFVWLAIAGPGPVSLDYLIERFLKRGEPSRLHGSQRSNPSDLQASA